MASSRKRVITVKVTQAHIKKATEELAKPFMVRQPRCKVCPIAQALIDTGKFMYVGVGSAAISVVTKGGKSLEGRLPLVAQQFIEKYDNKREVRGFSFDLTLAPAIA